MFINNAMQCNPHLFYYIIFYSIQIRLYQAEVAYYQQYMFWCYLHASDAVPFYVVVWVGTVGKFHDFAQEASKNVLSLFTIKTRKLITLKIRCLPDKSFTNACGHSVCTYLAEIGRVDESHFSWSDALACHQGKEEEREVKGREGM